MTTPTYSEFLEAKASLATPTGLDVDPAEVHPMLKPHQRDTVVWAVRGGRRAVFASFGLGKTFIQLEIIRLVLAKLGGGRGLIVLPLGVRQEFTRDAAKLGLEVTFVRSHTDTTGDGIYTTNYESVRDGKLDPRQFDVVSLDEAAILRGFGGSKTFREFMRMYEGSGNYRFVATATPEHRKPRRDGSTYCPSAGLHRNSDMVADGADECVAFPGAGPGTLHCMAQAAAAGIPVHPIPAPHLAHHTQEAGARRLDQAPLDLFGEVADA